MKKIILFQNFGPNHWQKDPRHQDPRQMVLEDLARDLLRVHQGEVEEVEEELEEVTKNLLVEEEKHLRINQELVRTVRDPLRSKKEVWVPQNLFSMEQHVLPKFILRTL